MVLNRTSTKYERLRDSTEASEYADNIELLPKASSEAHYEEDALDINQYEATPGPVAAKSSCNEDMASPPTSTGYRPQMPLKNLLLSGWRVGTLASLIGATLVCILNFVITVWVWNKPQFKRDGTLVTMLEGSCAETRKLNVWIHFIINVLSTLLLGASNYCMQVLSAPSRDEVVRAHEQRYWLHIGVPSVRNLLRIGSDRAVLWFLLFISSVPLHLFFNSVVFTNLQANEHTIIPTTEIWLQGGEYNTSNFFDVDISSTKTIVAEIDRYRDGINLTEHKDDDDLQATQKVHYTNMTTEECFKNFGGQYISEWGNLALIQEEATVWRNTSKWALFINSSGSLLWELTNNTSWNYTNAKNETELLWRQNSTGSESLPFFSSPMNYPSDRWRCPSHRSTPCDVDNENEVPKDRSKWKPYESPVKYCLAEKVRELCRLQFSFPIAVVVIVANFIKATCMAFMLLKYKNHMALVTVGDAVASFLDRPDLSTKGRCLYSRHFIEDHWNQDGINDLIEARHDVKPEKFEPRIQRWAMAPSWTRWCAAYVLYTASIIFGIVCIFRSLQGMPKDLVKLWNVGFGSLSGNNLLDLGTSVIGGVLLANTPQAVLSYLYLAFNALCTNMFIAREWSSYINERKTLRVSSPVGQQRSTYWLNVPFRYAIPLILMSGLFHWLASQSIFMVQISITGGAPSEARRSAGQISTCGYSPFAIILTTVIGTIIAAAGLIIGNFRYKYGMPLASSCSAAISAACHPPQGDENASAKAVQWGAVTHDQGSFDGKPVGHCSFSSMPVEKPILGRLYA